MPEIGQTISHYRILQKIGAGGMGEVYLAEDLSLDRKVALKFLPDVFTGDPERMARFEREAKLLASLNHPNIAAIYGLEQANGNRFLIMEYVEGETLQARLSKGALPIEDALGVCRQIAEGLEAAHEKGVIHRDLKPANVMITAEEKVKILDFGLAKALLDEGQSVNSSQSPTITEAMTQPGVVLGTAAYMSPEQAKGKSVDKRADIWAFGCILYECLSGKRVFEGETVTETLAAILRGEPDWEALPDGTPQNIRFVLRRCLEKNTSRRIRDAADLRILVEEALNLGDAMTGIESTRALIAVKQRWVWLACILAAAFIVMALAGAWYWFTHLSSVDLRVIELSLMPPEETSFKTFAVSPNGHWIAFAAARNGKDQLWIRSFDGLEARALPGTERASYPVWSPDSRFIGFFDGNSVKKIEVSGGPVQVICEEGEFWGGSWNRDGEIIFNGSGLGLKRVSAEGGKVSVLTTADITRQESDHYYPSFLPDGRHFVYYIASRQEDTEGIYLGSMDGAVKKRLIKDATSPLYASSGSNNGGYLIFKRGEALLAQPIDIQQLEMVGESFLIAEHAGSFSASHNGLLVFNPRVEQWAPQYVWVNRNGQQISSFGVERGYCNPQISPNDDRVAIDRVSDDGSTDIWLYDVQGGHKLRFTFDPALDGPQVWSPDGSHIIFSSNRDGNIFNLYKKAVSGTKNEELLLESSEHKRPTNWSSDGHFLLYEVFDSNNNNSDIGVLPLEDESEPFLFLKTEFSERAAQLSPDGGWLVYQSDESGRNEIYVQSFPKGGGKRQISTNRGMNPQWRRDGKELFYYAEGKLMAAQVKTNTATEIAFEPPMPLFDYPSDAFRLYTSNADGQRFLITQTENETAAPLTVILNWTKLLGK